MDFKKTISDEILMLIVTAMGKMSDRAAITRQIYDKYHVNSIFELTDDESLDVLSYCDPLSHKKIMDERNAKDYNENLVLLNAAIEKFVDENKDYYQILTDGPGYYLMCKKIKPTVHIEINPSLFQPIEKNELRQYLILFLVQTEEKWEDPDTSIKELMDMDIKHLKIFSWKYVKTKLEAIE